eukprot:TRINITY_DN67935_c10_g2_i1.p1 TRINITY_DN67935_c10_g2~~TRINITY_DN67935_c10_g2_i1.p1  ORF type:complete len:310 (+),score=65.41 TRINITY_DN67935_c10_g2_i1:52-930(+)
MEDHARKIANWRQELLDIKELTNCLGTASDSAALRARLHKLRNSMSDAKRTEIPREMNALRRITGAEPQNNRAKQLVNECQKLLRNANQTIQDSQITESAAPPLGGAQQPTTTTEEDLEVDQPGTTTSTLQAQTQVRPQLGVAFTEEDAAREINSDLQHVVGELTEAQRLMEELHGYVERDDEKMNQIKDNVDSSESLVGAGNAEIKKAWKKKKRNAVIGAMVVGATVGAAVGGPVGLAIGAKSVGAVAGICAAGSVTGTATAYAGSKVAVEAADRWVFVEQQRIASPPSKK